MSITPLTVLHFRGCRKAIREGAYPEMEGFYSDVGKADQDKLRSYVERGVNYVRLCDTNTAYLCAPKVREDAR